MPEENQSAVEQLIEKYEKELLHDLQFDEFTITEMLVKLYSIRSKWNTLLAKHRIKLAKAKRDKKYLIEKTIEELSTRSRDDGRDPITKVRAKYIAENQKEVKKYDKFIDEMEPLIKFLEETLKNAYSTGFDIRARVDIMKMDE